MTEKFPPFLNKMKTVKKNVKIIRCDNAGENKTLNEIYCILLKKLTLNLRHQELHIKMTW